MKKIFVILILIGVGYYAYVNYWPSLQRYLPSKSSAERVIPLSDYRIERAEIGSYKYSLYVAETDQQRTQGLSDLPSLKPNHGMIFIFSNTDRHTFWMKGMRFNLDYIFLDGRTVVDLIENVSPETFPAQITPRKAANRVIELPAGEILKTGIQRGDFIEANL